MAYVPSVKSPEKGDIRGHVRGHAEWELAWERATHTQEYIGLIHGIYESVHQNSVFRWLLEAADEFRMLAESSRHSDSLLSVAEAALEMAIKRSIRSRVDESLWRSPENLACFFWFMRIEKGRRVNSASCRRIRAELAKELMNTLQSLCERAFDPKEVAFHLHRVDAIRILYHYGCLTRLYPNPSTFSTTVVTHPWNVFDEESLEVLKELALCDASVLGADSVEYAFVHGSPAATLYITASKARATLHELQRGA